MQLLESLRAGRLLAIVRGSEADSVLRTVLILAEEGVGLIEVSLTSRDALGVLTRARAELGPGVPLGAGTVLTAGQARRARDSGADFAVTPGLGEGFDESRRIGLPVLAGALTPTEITSAGQSGADAVKLFPAGPLGGADYLRALRGPFPDVPFVPVGGMDAAAMRDCLAAGAVAVGVGSPLVGDAADGGDPQELRARARTYLAIAATGGRPGPHTPAAGPAGTAAPARPAAPAEPGHRT